MATDGNREVILEMESHPNGGEEGGRVEVPGVCEREMGYLEREIYLQVQLYADEENDSPEIKRKKRMARAALTLWKERSETLQHRMLQGKSEMRSIMNEVYQLVGLYIVFEGVVLTSVATSSRLECQHLWSPVGLSLFAYSMLVVVALKKFWDIRDLRWMKEMDRHTTKEVMRWVSRLRLLGYEDFDFDRDCRLRRRDIPPLRFWRNALGLIVPLTMFTAGLVFSLIHILCWS